MSRDPLALLIGMVLDQQITIEKAFSSPAELARRLGARSLDAASIAAMEPDELAAVFKERPALHRFPGSMAGRVQDVCRAVAEDYGNRADAIWKGVRSGEELVGRLRALPGFGEQKSKIFAALLGKQLGVRPEGLARGHRPLRRARGPTCRWPTSPTPRAWRRSGPPRRPRRPGRAPET